MHSPPKRLLPALALPLAFAACGPSSTAPVDAGPVASAAAPRTSASAAPQERARAPVREGGAIVRAAGEDALYVADEDHKVLRRIPLPLPESSAAVGAPIPLPGAPAQVLALADRVLVTIRDPGLLLILKPEPGKGLVEVARVELPADAWGLAVTPDEATALVTSAWTHQLSSVDLATAKVRWSIDVPREPRAVVVRPDGASAYVTHLVGPALTRVDDLATTPKIHAVELPPAPARTPSAKTLDASLAYSAVLNEDGSRLFVARHALGALGQGSWFGAMTIDVLATRADTPVLSKRLPGMPVTRHPVIGQMLDAGLVTSLDISGTELAPVTQPRAAVLRKSTRTILVAGEGDDRVAEFDALSVAPAMRPIAVYKVGGGYDPRIPVASTGGAPSGLALSADEKTVYVFCRSTDDVVALSLGDPDRAPPILPVKPPLGRAPEAPAVTATLHLADDALPKEAALGRRFFYNSTDVVVSGGLGCAGCHPDGRDDGHVWHEASVDSINESPRTIFLAEPELAPNEKDRKIGYARQTPMLAGRIGADGPYGWHAQAKDLAERLKEGFALHRWSSIYAKGVGEQLARIQYVRAFAREGLVAPPKVLRELTEQEKAGERIFLSEGARCSKCHVPLPEYTDRGVYAFSPKAAPPEGFEEDPVPEFRTPSLRFVGGTPPYFHDGRYRSLEQVVDLNEDRMGRTSSLTKDERAALVSFLRTL